MGKSSLFQFLSKILKESQPSYWILKIDLNSFSDALDGLTRDVLTDFESAIEFLINQILKPELELTRYHFREACLKTGKVVILLDGFDEIASSYEHEVLNLVNLLLKTNIQRIYISTRPECCQRLESEFLQIKYSLMPFNESDQVKYMTNFIKAKTREFDEEILKKTMDAVAQSMKKSISDRDLKFTGIPLVTKLVSELFEYEIVEIFQNRYENLDEKLENIISKKFNLWSLYQNFVTKSFKIYFEEKCLIDEKNAANKKRIEKEKKIILDNYETFAIKQFLKTNLIKYFQRI
jgi:hypothetical protein